VIWPVCWCFLFSFLLIYFFLSRFHPSTLNLFGIGFRYFFCFILIYSSLTTRVADLTCSLMLAQVFIFFQFCLSTLVWIRSKLRRFFFHVFLGSYSHKNAFLLNLIHLISLHVLLMTN